MSADHKPAPSGNPDGADKPMNEPKRASKIARMEGGFQGNKTAGKSLIPLCRRRADYQPTFPRIEMSCWQAA